MKLSFKETAVNDILSTEAYIRDTLGNPSAAKKLKKQIYEAAELLPDNPYMGEELSSKFDLETDLRFFIVRKQIIFYRVIEPSLVEITRVLDGRQDYLSLIFP
mgnify:CR=1 FL=1